MSWDLRTWGRLRRLGLQLGIVGSSGEVFRSRWWLAASLVRVRGALLAHGLSPEHQHRGSAAYGFADAEYHVLHWKPSAVFLS